MEIDSQDLVKTEREADVKNMARTYNYRNEGLQIKIKTMRLLYQKVELLEQKAQSCYGEEQLRLIEVMADLGRAILPD